MVGPIVTCCRIAVPNPDALDIEGVATFRRWYRSHPRRPRIIVIGVSCIPEPHHCFHRRLGILVVGPNAVRCFQRTNSRAIVFPNDPFRRPVKRVSMELCHRRGNFWRNGMIIKPCDAFTKPTCLYFVLETSSKLPIELVKVIG